MKYHLFSAALLLSTATLAQAAMPADTTWNCGRCDSIYSGCEATSAVTATLTFADSTLTINGTGAMQQYADTVDAPWSELLPSVRTIVIGEGITDADEVIDYAFGAVAFKVANGNAHYSSVDGVLFNKDTTALLKYPDKRRVRCYTIPISVTAIESMAFAFCTIDTLNIPSSVTRLANLAFVWPVVFVLNVWWKTPPSVSLLVFGPPLFFIFFSYLRVPNGTREFYAAAEGWNEFTIVERAASHDATLRSLAIPGATLWPAFRPDVSDYRCTVPADTTAVSVLAQPTDPYATVRITSTADVTDTIAPFALDSGDSYLVVLITAEDGSTVYAYTITVERAELATAVAANRRTILRLYPNPTTGELTIKNEELKIGDRVEVYNLQGTLVMTKKLSTVNCQLSIEHLPSGTYIVKAGNAVGTVVKQ